MENSNNINSIDITGPSETTALRPKLETFDDVLPYVGDFGRYQWLLLLALFPYGVTYATLYFSQFFLTLIPSEHWCKIEELVNANVPTQDRIQLAIPASENYPYYDQCNHKDLNFAEILKNGVNSNSYEYKSYQFQSNRTVKCSRWEYNFTEIPYSSIGSELDWVCDREYLVSTAQSIFFGGSIVGGFVFGWIADHKGRIPAILACNTVALVGSIVTAHANSFWTFSICRFLTGLAFDNCINIPLIIVMEYMAVTRRSLVVNLAFGIYFALGSTLLPWTAYYIANWKYFAYASALPMMSVIITPWILPESARWYVSNGMSDKVIEKLRRIAKINRKNLDPRIYDVLARNLDASKTVAETATVFDLFKSPRLARNTILLTFFWSLTVVAFDGNVYSLKLLQSSVFVSFSLACATELPAGLLLTLVLDRWGRRFCGFITLAMAGLFSIATLMIHSSKYTLDLMETITTLLMPDVTSITKLILSVTSRFCLNMGANVGLQYAAELLPTPVRSQGVSFIHIFGIIAHSLAPFVIDSAKVWEGLPMLIIGTISFVGASFVLFLPETLGQSLPQTLHEGEEFGKDQNFWSLPCLRKSHPEQQNSHYNT